MSNQILTSPSNLGHADEAHLHGPLIGASLAMGAVG